MNEKKFINADEIEKYKKFAFKEDMLKMSVAFMLGGSFNKVVKGISDFIIMPFINFIIMQTGDSWRKWRVSPIKNLEIEMGQFLGILVDFILISIILYVIYHKLILESKIYNIKDNLFSKDKSETDSTKLEIDLPSKESEKKEELIEENKIDVKPRRNRKQNKGKKNTRGNKKRPNG